MTLKLKILAVSAVIASMAVPAAAATFGFQRGSLGANGAYNGTYSASVDGVTLNATAGRYGNDTIIDTDCSNGGCGYLFRQVRKSNSGMGVSGFFDGSSIDGNFGNDLLTFTFDRVVDFGQILFSGVDANDDFDVFVDGALVLADVNIAQANPFDLSSLLPATGSSISFGADGRFDNFRIAAISVSAVPLPASALLLLAGVGGLGAMRRRKNKQ